MKNSTKFLDDIMANSIHQYIVIDVTDKPTFEDWWAFEEECLGEHFGMDRERNSGWWATYFVSEVSTLAINNFILLEIKVVGGEYVLEYLEEAMWVEDFDEPYVDMLMIPFSEIYNKYLLKPLPETLGEPENKNVHILSQEELDELCGIAEEREQANMFGVVDTNEELLKPNKRPTTMSDYLKNQEEGLKEAQEEIDSLNSTIKDMEEIIQRYEHNLTFVWTMLEQKIKESK